MSAQLAHLAKLLRRTSADMGPAPSAPGPGTMVGRVIRGRRLREQFFDQHLFADPAWDILLDLFLAKLEQRRVTVSSVCAAAGVPPTTALRYIALLVDGGLLVRTPNPLDQRIIFLELTPSSSERMQAYFEKYSALLTAPVGR